MCQILSRMAPCQRGCMLTLQFVHNKCTFFPYSPSRCTTKIYNIWRQRVMSLRPLVTGFGSCEIRGPIHVLPLDGGFVYGILLHALPGRPQVGEEVAWLKRNLPGPLYPGDGTSASSDQVSVVVFGFSWFVVFTVVCCRCRGCGSWWCWWSWWPWWQELPPLMRDVTPCHTTRYHTVAVAFGGWDCDRGCDCGYDCDCGCGVTIFMSDGKFFMASGKRKNPCRVPAPESAPVRYRFETFCIPGRRRDVRIRLTRTTMHLPIPVWVWV